MYQMRSIVFLPVTRDKGRNEEDVKGISMYLKNTLERKGKGTGHQPRLQKSRTQSSLFSHSKLNK